MPNGHLVTININFHERGMNSTSLQVEFLITNLIKTIIFIKVLIAILAMSHFIQSHCKQSPLYYKRETILKSEHSSAFSYQEKID